MDYIQKIETDSVKNRWFMRKSLWYAHVYMLLSIVVPGAFAVQRHELGFGSNLGTFVPHGVLYRRIY